MVKNLSACQCRRHGSDLWVGKIHGEGNRNPLQLFLLGKSHRQRRLAGYSPWGYKRVGHNSVTEQPTTNTRLLRPVSKSNRILLY